MYRGCSLKLGKSIEKPVPYKYGLIAKWKGESLQNSYTRVRFPLRPLNCPGGGTGLRKGLKILGSQGLVGSNPTPGTI